MPYILKTAGKAMAWLPIWSKLNEQNHSIYMFGVKTLNKLFFVCQQIHGIMLVNI